MTATTPDATASSLGALDSSRRLDVQGLRAVAVIVVVAFHAGLPLTGGFVGVDIFFVISGFVITGLLLRQRARGPLRLSTFYARRAKRLLPALALMLVVVLTASVFLQSPYGNQQATVSTAIGTMLLASNIVILRSIGGYFSAPAESNALLNTWSLSVEEQFYLVFPLLVLLAFAWGARRSNARTVLAWLMAVVVLGSFTLSLLLSFDLIGASFTTQPEAWAFYTPFTRSWEFGVGVLLALWATRQPGSGSRGGAMATALAVIGTVLVIASIVRITPETPFPGIAALAPVLGVAALIAAGIIGRNPVSALLSTRPMTAIGDASYSIYLWHWPVIVLAVAVWPGAWTAHIAAVASLLPAWLAYRYVERPIHRSSGGTDRRILLAALATSAAVIVFALLVQRVSYALSPIGDADARPPMAQAAGCLLMDTTFTPEDIARCTFGAPAPGGRILLLGDSHADAVSTGVIEAARELGLATTALTAASCPFVDDPTVNSRVANCTEMVRALLAEVTGANPPRAVILAQRGVPAGLETSIDRITAAGVPVIFVRDAPAFRPEETVGALSACRGGLLNFSCEIDRMTADANLRATRAAEGDLLARRPGLVVVDPWPEFCSETTCSATKGDALAYADFAHLNDIGSRALADEFRAALATTLGSGGS